MKTDYRDGLLEYARWCRSWVETGTSWDGALSDQGLDAQVLVFECAGCGVTFYQDLIKCAEAAESLAYEGARV